MTIYRFLLAAAPLAVAIPAWGQTAVPSQAATSASATDDDAAPARAKAASSDVVTTGVARGRDRLDSAVSTSSLKQIEILKLAPRSLGEILRDVPGIRSEATFGEGAANISIRGLPIASSGSKFLQLQEDGLPVLEFGDITFGSADTFLRADINLAQVDVIRGGSASTFASNSPGGIVNFISKTGDVEGGAVQVTSGLDYEQYRVDMDYGAKISETLRFHVGGFYRRGEGPRSIGYDAEKGGQIKLNVTKDFPGGYVRLYGKYLNDRAPIYDVVPARVTGTNDKPKYANIAGFDVGDDVLLARNLRYSDTLDANNDVLRSDLHDGQHPIVKSVGVETQFEVMGFSLSERFRYADNALHSANNIIPVFASATAVAAQYGGPGAVVSYATGPNRGQVITDLAGLNGNGLLMPATVRDTYLSLNNGTNDLRLSRVWNMGGGELTTTTGIYNSRQQIDVDQLWTSVISDVRGNGEAALVNIADRTGRLVTQDGVYGFGAFFLGGRGRRVLRTDYSVDAPFGSLNYRLGRVAIGGSLRYDFGRARGTLFGSELGGGRVGITSRDINGDGTLSAAERRVSVLPLDRPAPVHYNYEYLSYSTGINFRVADPLAVFARYSRGGRGAADRVLFSAITSPITGDLFDKGTGVDLVRQAEAGVKYRNPNLTLNVTGFWARSEDTNITAVGNITRDYGAEGVEFEGGYRSGIFSLNGGATYIQAKIRKDVANPVLEGNTPARQPKFIYQATPQIITDRFSVGAVFIGTTGSFTTDSNQLRIPGFTTTNAFVQVRPVERLLLSLNANNVFDVDAFVAAPPNATIPANGIVIARALNGRTVSASLRFDF